MELKSENKVFGLLCIMVMALFVVVLIANHNLAQAKDKPIVWQAQSAYGSGLSYFKHAQYFADRVKQMSNGRLIIQVNTGGSLVPKHTEQDAVAKGSLDMSLSTSMYIRGKFPESVLLGNSAYDMKAQEFIAWLEYGGGYELWQEMYDNKKWNVKVLPAYCFYCTESLGWFRKPIRTLDDFKGMKFRTVGEWGEVLQGLGASVVTLPGGELYSALEKGVLDGTDMSHPAFDKGLGLYEICKFNLYPGVHQVSGPMETLVRPELWEALPKDLQQIVIAAAREATLRSITQTVIEDAAAVEFFRTKGVKIIKLSPETLAVIHKKFNEVYDKRAAKYPFYKKVLNSQKAFHKKWHKYDQLQSW